MNRGRGSREMRKTLMVTALFTSAVFVYSHERFIRFGCGGQAIASGIVHALSWKLCDELLTMEVERLANRTEQTTCPSIMGPSPSLVTFIL